VRRLVPTFLSVGLVAAAIIVLVLHGPMDARDRGRLAALDAVEPVIPRGATIGTCPTAAADWGLQSYLQRLFRISLDARGSPVSGWFLVANADCRVPAGCDAQAGDSRIQLYRCAAPLLHGR
jgi:hypothetical protein